MTDKVAVLVTTGSVREANRIARAIVSRRLAACVNILKTPVRSIYRWKGKVEAANEFLVVIKTSRRRFPELQDTIRSLHSYDVPEIIALPVAEGSRPYLDWISDSLRSPRKPRRKRRES